MKMDESAEPFLDLESIKAAKMSPIEERAVSLNICIKCLSRGLIERAKNVKQCQECFTVYVTGKFEAEGGISCDE